jgi:hypothetical protein
VKTTIFPHLHIHKYTWTSLDGKIHNQIDHLLIGDGNSNILDVRSFREADRDTDHYLVGAKVRERMNLRKPNELEVRIKYQTKTSKRFVALEKLSDSEDINLV